MSSANKDSFISSFPICMPFISLPCLIAVARTSNNMLSKSGKSILIVFLNLEERLSAFHHWVRCWLWICHTWPVLCWGKFPLRLLFGDFDHKWVLNFVKSFYCIYWDYHMVFILQFVNMVYQLIDLCILKKPCIPGITPLDHGVSSF